jgi:hypothetical protein
MSLDPSERKSWVERWSSWLTENWLELLYALVPVVGFALVGVFFSLALPSAGWITFAASTLGLVVLIVLRQRQQTHARHYLQQVKALQLQLKEEEQRYALLEEAFYTQLDQGRSHFGFLLNIISRELAFDSTHRISVYVHNGEGFVAVARYSENPSYHRPGRPCLPADEGVLGACWQDGKASLTGLPDPKSKVDYRKKSQISPEYEKGFAMKSRSYFGKSIHSVDGYRRVGVIILESTQPQGLDLERIEEALQRHQGSLHHILLGAKDMEKMWEMGL